MVSQGHQTWSFNKHELGGIQNILSVFHSARNGFPTGIFKRLEASLPEYPRKFPGLRTQPGAVVSPQRASAGLRKRQLIQGTMVYVTIIVLTQRRFNKNHSLQQPVRVMRKNPVTMCEKKKPLSLYGELTEGFQSGTG